MKAFGMAIAGVLAASCGDTSGWIDVPTSKGGSLVDRDSDTTAMPDSDDDGLCDDTEMDLGTNPHALDSDGDTLPDLLELAFGLDPSSALSPARDAIAYLPSTDGATASLEPRVTVDNREQALSYTGRFLADASLYTDPVTAADYLVDQQALSATPPDNVLGLDPENSRFIGVRGRTRLSFALQFAYPDDTTPPPCALLYGFDYRVTAENRLVASSTYLLVIGSGQAAPQATDFCAPTSCM